MRTSHGQRAMTVLSWLMPTTRPGAPKHAPRSWVVGCVLVGCALAPYEVASACTWPERSTTS